MKISTCVLILSFFIGEELLAQTGGHGQFQVLSPNAYEFARYGDVPVDLSSGVANVNVPLMTMVDKDISLDVSLSYNASGIKVDQEATWVGLGWVLNCGGVITRELRGTPDGFLPRTSIPDWKPGTGQTVSQYVFAQRGNIQVGANGGSDNGADMFYYNFNGKSGKFFLDDNMNPVFTKYEDFKVTFEPVYSNNILMGHNFIITDDRGFVYEFKVPEFTNSVIGGASYISAWNLSKIISPSGAYITIEYVEGGMSTYQYQKRCFSEAFIGTSPSYGIHDLPQKYSTARITYDATVTASVPKKITTSAGNSLEFVTATTPRLDAEGWGSLSNNQLKSLVLRDYLNNEIRRFNFSYGYFEANDNRKFPTVSTSDPRTFLNYRLRLDAVQEVSPLGEINPPYTFSYFGDNNPQTDDALTLPYRLSPSQDHWGYYNGSNNLTIFPYNAPNKQWHIDDTYRKMLANGEIGDWTPNFTFWIPGANREGDKDAVKAGMLKRIAYPTGGFTEFEFEGHSYSIDNYWPIAGGVRIKQVTSNPGTGPSVVKQYEYEDNMSSDKCLDLNNRYYSWYWNRQFNDPTYGDANMLMAFGVPGDLASGYTYVVRAEGSSQLVLGAGNNAVYTRVREKMPGNGYTIYEYSFSIDGEVGIGGGDASEEALFPGLFSGAYVLAYPMGGYDVTYLPYTISSCSSPFPKFFNNDWRRGYLKFKDVYSEDGTLLERDSIQYQIQATKGVPGYSFTAWPNGAEYIYARYYNVGGLVKPLKEVKFTYANGNVLRTAKEYEYTSPYHKQVTQTRQSMSNGEFVTTKYYYPTEYPYSFGVLKSKNILQPIDTRNYKNGKLIDGAQVSYSDGGLLTAYYKAEVSGIDIPFSNQTPFTFSPKLEMQYNIDNTLRYQSDITGKSEIFLWSYKGLHPIAKIENLSYASLLEALNDPNEIFINQLRNKAEPSVSDLTTINALRQHASLRLSPVTTYTYKPLIGMTSQTNPSGRATYFEYDSFGRLKLIRDHNNNIIKQYSYTFQTVANTNPIWQATGATRCKPCPSNTAYTTNMEQIEEKDGNPNSATYNQTRWTDTGNPGTCTAPAAWTNTTTAVRCRQVSGQNTGEQEQEQRDLNPCSSTYNQTRWIVVATNTTACPVPCNTSNCNGNDKKCVNGVCETGGAVVVSSVYQKVTIDGLQVWKWVCTRKYCFSDGTQSTYSWVTYHDSSCSTGWCAID